MTGDKKLALITGSGGQLGTAYQLTKGMEGWDYLFLNREDLDITRLSQVENVFASFAPDVCVNLGAYTNIEKCEKEDIETSFEVNSNGPRNLGIAGAKFNVPIIHISSDHVFDGNKDGSYTEKDIPSPVNNYGRTKLMGEKYLKDVTDHYYIIRTSNLYSNYGESLYTELMRKAQRSSEIYAYANVFSSFTSVHELCRAIDLVIAKSDDKTLSGVYHFSGRGKANHRDFAEEIYKQGRISMIVSGSLYMPEPHKPRIPLNTYLNTDKFSMTFEYSPVHWKNALQEVISERKTLPIKVGDIVVENGNSCVVVATDWSKRTASLARLEKMDESFEIPLASLELYERK